MNEKITIILDGAELSVSSPLVISSLFKDEDFTYEANPVVAVKIAGELKSLNYKLEWNAEVESVRLFSPLGKRVYRHSICHLLSYAAIKLYPERHVWEMVIFSVLTTRRQVKKRQRPSKR